MGLPSHKWSVTFFLLFLGLALFFSFPVTKNPRIVSTHSPDTNLFDESSYLSQTISSISDLGNNFLKTTGKPKNQIASSLQIKNQAVKVVINPEVSKFIVHSYDDLLGLPNSLADWLYSSVLGRVYVIAHDLPELARQSSAGYLALIHSIDLLVRENISNFSMPELVLPALPKVAPIPSLAQKKLNPVSAVNLNFVENTLKDYLASDD